MPELRDYQLRALSQLYTWFASNTKGHPCIELPTGAGKSHVIAALCKDALTHWPETRILMLTHVKELIEQNLDKLLAHWPEAPVGVYSASVGRKELGQPITYAGVQSIWRRADDVGHIDLVIIDEAHLVSHHDTGMYRTLIKALTGINPYIRIVGLTATPYRLSHGLITDPPALFDVILRPAPLEELIAKGYLSVLRSKTTDTEYDTTGIKTRQGEFVESELQARVNTTTLNSRVVSEIIARADDRQHWLAFCAGVDHAEAVAAEFISQGITAACVTGETPKGQREEIIRSFKAGKIRALTNANVLTTGFDYPDIDLIAMLRPTQSPGLYMQMAGRGLRLKSHTDHCLVLDFAGNVSRHGPITAVIPPDRANGNGNPPVKKCPQCREICAASCKTCPACGFIFTSERVLPALGLRNDDIMRLQEREVRIAGWRWRVHISRQSGKQLLACDYQPLEMLGKRETPWLTDYFPVHHGGYAEQRAWRELEAIATQGARVPVSYASSESLDEIAEKWQKIPPPSRIFFIKEGNFFRVTKRVWED